MAASSAVSYVAATECVTLHMDNDGREAAQQTTDIILMSKETYKQTVCRPFKWKHSHTRDLAAWLEIWGKKLLVDPDDNNELEASVVELVSSLSDHMRNHEMKFDFKIRRIGSYYSRTKKHPPDEFDFLCESQMPTDQLRFVHQPLPSTETTDFSRPDFFLIYDANNHELRAEDWRRDFQKGLKNALNRRFPDCAIEYNGPARSFIVEAIPFNEHLKYPVKVDMTFAIRLDAEEPDHIWPLQNTPVTLAKCEPLPGLERLAQCHFVPFGDLWRVSFAGYECDLIRNFSKEKRSFSVAMKNLRDLVSVSEKNEPTVISSHILQSAFLAEEREHPDTEFWKGRNLAIRAQNVLRRLHEKDVPHAVLNHHMAYSNPGQDTRTSIEARRLIRFTESAKEISVGGLRHLSRILVTLMVIFVCVCNIVGHIDIAIAKGSKTLPFTCHLATALSAVMVVCLLVYFIVLLRQTNLLSPSIRFRKQFLIFILWCALVSWFLYACTVYQLVLSEGEDIDNSTVTVKPN